MRKKERKKKEKKEETARNPQRQRERKTLVTKYLLSLKTTKWVVRKTKAKEKKKTIKDWGSMVSFKYCSCKNVKEEDTHTSSWERGREGGRSVTEEILEDLLSQFASADDDLKFLTLCSQNLLSVADGTQFVCLSSHTFT